MNIKNKKGMSIIQLIGVIIILGILASIVTINVNKSIDESEFSSKLTKANLLDEVVAKYQLEHNELPTVNPTENHINTPVLIDISKVAPDEEKNFKGQYFIYGSDNKVYYDYPPQYILEVFNNVVGTYPIMGRPIKGNIIDVKKLYTDGHLDYPPETNYMIETNNGIQRVVQFYK